MQLQWQCSGPKSKSMKHTERLFLRGHQFARVSRFMRNGATRLARLQPKSGAFENQAMTCILFAKSRPEVARGSDFPSRR